MQEKTDDRMSFSATNITDVSEPKQVQCICSARMIFWTIYISRPCLKTHNRASFLPGPGSKKERRGNSFSPMVSLSLKILHYIYYIINDQNDKWTNTSPKWHQWHLELSCADETVLSRLFFWKVAHRALSIQTFIIKTYSLIHRHSRIIRLKNTTVLFNCMAFSRAKINFLTSVFF